MSTYVRAYIEYQQQVQWQLVKIEQLADNEPPHNVAPGSWGEYNFNVYYQQSGEKGLPSDLSVGLQKVIENQLNQHTDEALNRPPWMSLGELFKFFESDVDHQYAHFDLQYLQQLKEELNANIRVIFWAE